MWDEERGVYVDARHNGRRSRRIGQASNAAVVAFGVAPPERRRRIWQTVLDPARLVLTHALGADGQVTPFEEETQVVRAQPFTCHLLHRALRLDGRHDNIVQQIRQAWSGTPTFDLSTDQLGVAPLLPGCRRLRVAPQPADLSWARGVFPLPQGALAVAWMRTGLQFDLQVGVPAGCEAELVPPPSWAWADACPAVVGSGSHRRRALPQPVRL